MTYNITNSDRLQSSNKPNFCTPQSVTLFRTLALLNKLTQQNDSQADSRSASQIPSSFTGYKSCVISNFRRALLRY